MFHAVTGPGGRIDAMVAEEFDVWSFDEDRWICLPAKTGVVRASEERHTVFDVVMQDLPGRSVEDFTSPFACTQGQKLLCPDMKYRTVEELVEKRLPVQHPRGNGHITKIKLIAERPEKELVYAFAVPKWMNVIHGAVVFSTAGVPA